MKRLFFILSILFICSASTCNRKIENEIEQSTMIEFADTVSRKTLDSIFIADEISFDLENDWMESPVVDENRKDILYKYVYIKELTDSMGIIYTLYTYQDSLFIINKRVIK